MPPNTPSSRLEPTAFYILLATVFLAPIAFWPSIYIAPETVKALIIGVGALVSALLYVIISFKERRLTLPPKSLSVISGLIAVSIVVSAFVSGQPGKSFFGQGFELAAGGFLVILFMAGFAAWSAISRRSERAVVVYAAAAGSFLLLYAFHLLRFIFGTKFATLGILSAESQTSTILGGWFSLAIYAGVVALIGLAALIFLPLSRRMKAFYAVIIALSFLGLVVVNSVIVWQAAALVLLGLTINISVRRPRLEGPFLPALIRRVAWLPLIACAIAALCAWKGSAVFAPVIDRLNAGYSELSLPWQMTLDVGVDTLKDGPLFGAGPNRFTQAFLTHKPAGINQTEAWSVEFGAGFGLIPTFAVTQGLVGLVLWILLLVYFGILGARSLRRLPDDDLGRFIVISSYVSAAFLWIMAILYVPSQAMFLLAFVMTGIWLGASASSGGLSAWEASPIGGRFSRLFAPGLGLAAVILALLAAASVKDFAALAYFGGGVRQLNVAGNTAAADRAFTTALKLNPMDVYWQARAEAAIASASQSFSSVNASSPASTTQKAAADVAASINNALKYAQSAVAYDPSNYYNYLSMARVAEAASNLRIADAYQTGVNAYVDAIKRNPSNPGLYVSLARFQAANQKLDDALQTIGAALQVKNNYIDAAFLLSQVETAKGNLSDAVTAARFAVELNPSNPLLFFQLGLLQYNQGDYAASAATLAQAVKIQADYANARYFLGLAYARLGRNADAIAQFEILAQANPDNQEVSLILSNLRAGRSPFIGAKPPVTAAPEKRASPPIPAKRR